LFGVHAATGESDCKQLVETMLDEIARASETITAAEVARAKAQLRAGLLMTLENPAARAGQLARHMLFHGRPLPLDEIIGHVNAVTPERVGDYIGGIVTGSVPTLSTIG